MWSVPDGHHCGIGLQKDLGNLFGGTNIFIVLLVFQCKVIKSKHPNISPQKKCTTAIFFCSGTFRNMWYTYIWFIREVLEIEP